MQHAPAHLQAVQIHGELLGCRMITFVPSAGVFGNQPLPGLWLGRVLGQLLSTCCFGPLRITPRSMDLLKSWASQIRGLFLPLFGGCLRHLLPLPELRLSECVARCMLPRSLSMLRTVGPVSRSLCLGWSAHHRFGCTCSLKSGPEL